MFWPVSGGLLSCSGLVAAGCYIFWRRTLKDALEQSEAYDGVISFGHTNTLADLAHAFTKHFQSSDSKSLTKAEFVTILNANRTVRRHCLPRPPAPPPPPPARARVFAQRVLVEWAPHSCRGHQEPLSPAAENLIFDMVDTDKDGHLDYREYLTFFTKWKED